MHKQYFRTFPNSFSTSVLAPKGLHVLEHFISKNGMDEYYEQVRSVSSYRTSSHLTLYQRQTKHSQQLKMFDTLLHCPSSHSLFPPLASTNLCAPSFEVRGPHDGFRSSELSSLILATSPCMSIFVGMILIGHLSLLTSTTALSIHCTILIRQSNWS
jgi:hypothetical protein